MNDKNDKFSGFNDVISDLSQIREIMGGEPPHTVLDKELDELDEVCKKIIAKSPFIVIASSDSKGCPDVSPKGDPIGFVKILDDKHLAIPDRPGNRRADTFQNIIENPYLSIIFIIPGKGETLRVTGEVRIVRDEPLRNSMAVNGKAPKFAIVMHIEKIIIHCPKCIVRAKLWEPDQWPDHSDTANIAEAMLVHAKLDMTMEELGRHAEDEGFTELY